MRNNLLVSWGRAWRGALAWFGWTLVWGSIGFALVGVGLFVAFGSLYNSRILGNLEFYATGDLFIGLVLMLIGLIVCVLAALASFFKISAEINSEKAHDTCTRRNFFRKPFKRI